VCAAGQEGDPEGWWEESFKGHVDSKPRGPEAISFDLEFPGVQHVYGLPEHATSLSLKPTVDLGGTPVFLLGAKPGRIPGHVGQDIWPRVASPARQGTVSPKSFATFILQVTTQLRSHTGCTTWMFLSILRTHPLDCMAPSLSCGPRSWAQQRAHSGTDLLPHLYVVW
jgi:hypothetical protein